MREIPIFLVKGTLQTQKEVVIFLKERMTRKDELQENTD